MTRDPMEALALLVYTLAYVWIAFVWRSLLVWRRAGVNPYVLPANDSAYGYVGRAMRVLLLTVLGLNLVPGLGGPARPNHRLAGPTSGLPGVGVAAGLPGLDRRRAGGDGGFLAQRGGQGRRTDLMQRGLFAHSRNPIFLGMRVNLLGLFLVMPNAVTLAVLVAGELVMGVQVRLEEAYLSRVHGEAYEGYRRRVRRWL